MSHKLRTAVVGVGYLGRFHAQKHKALPMAELVAVVDASPERASEVGKELSVEAASDYKKLLGRVDAVTVSTITPKHFEVSKFFLENGVHVLVEKPITVTVAEAEELVELSKKKNLTLQVGHSERFNPAFTKIRSEVQGPLFLRAERLAPPKGRANDVDVILDLMIHDLDLVLNVAESPVTAVSAVGVKVTNPSYDMVDARIDFQSGLVAHLTASRVSEATLRKFRVFQKDGYFSCDLGNAKIKHTRLTGDGPKTELLELAKGDGLLLETEAFLKSIAENSNPVVSGGDGVAAMKLVEMIQNDIHRRSR